jgi:branched-chain amino acid aminotransferase
MIMAFRIASQCRGRLLNVCARDSSTHSSQSSRTIASSALTIERTPSDDHYNSKPANEDLKFGVTLSDHMLECEWTASTSWGAPRIVPTHDLQLSPAASSLHYGLECFEGMKAFKSPIDGSLRLFRPRDNMKRLATSMERLQMHGYSFDGDELLACIKELVRVDERWVPTQEGYSLYVRPTVIATHPFLGLAAPESMLLYCVCSPVGPYYMNGFAPVRLTADTEYVRAWPGGTGNVKIGGNYGSAIRAGAAAAAAGYDQVLWTFGENDEATECG